MWFFLCLVGMKRIPHASGTDTASIFKNPMNWTNVTLVNDELDAQFFYFIIRLLQSSACFEQRSAHHMIKRSNCANTASGIVNLCKCPSGIQVERELVPSRHIYRTATYRERDYTRCCISTILFSWWWARSFSKHVEDCNKRITK